MTPEQLATTEPAAPAEPSGAAFRTLDPRVIQLDRIVGFIVTGCVFVAFGLGSLIFWVVSDTSWAPVLVSIAWPVVTTLLAWHSWAWPPVDFRHHSYRVDDLGIEIRRGVIWRTVINVPRSRVQHIDVSQGPIERRFGLGGVSIYTAGTEYAMVPLRGITHESALWVRDRLLPKEAQDAV
jgi:membrane protein YdbS with pleckstrin-like domain